MKNLLLKVLPSEIVDKLGFTPEAELLNGRLAMLGLGIGLLTELITKAGILAQLGLG
jgi:hypothetical protein